MTDQERQIKSQEILQAAIQAITQSFGMTIEAALQVEVISETYATNRAVIVMKPVANWQPQPNTQDK